MRNWVVFLLLFSLLVVGQSRARAAPITGTYDSVGGDPRVVGFDGTGFTGSATILSPLNPDWTAMSLRFAPDSADVPEPGSLALVCPGWIAALSFRRRCRRR